MLHQDKDFIIRRFSAEEQNLFCDLFEDPEVTKYLPYQFITGNIRYYLSADLSGSMSFNRVFLSFCH